MYERKIESYLENFHALRGFGKVISATMDSIEPLMIKSFGDMIDLSVTMKLSLFKSYRFKAWEKGKFLIFLVRVLGIHKLTKTPQSWLVRSDTWYGLMLELKYVRI
jgi:hypothetical protein